MYVITYYVYSDNACDQIIKLKLNNWNLLCLLEDSSCPCPVHCLKSVRVLTSKTFMSVCLPSQAVRVFDAMYCRAVYDR